MKTVTVMNLFALIGLAFVQAGAVPQPVVSGQVRLDSGQPAAGAQVLLFDLSDLRQGAVARTVTDGAGYFALNPEAPRGNALPQGFTLGPNYPNPFNPSTVIPYQLPASMHVRLEVFNLLGQRIATLVDGERPAGLHAARWDATDARGQAMAAGVYLYRLSGDGVSLTRRLVLIDGPAGVPAGTGGPVAAPEEAVEIAPVYGLTVSGPGLVPYVDPVFRVEAGRGLMDLVVEALDRAHPRPKLAATGILGDVDNNERVDFFDALLVALYSWDASVVLPNNGDITLGDVNADGRVDLSDAWLIATYLNDPSDPSLPPGIGSRPATASLSPDPSTVSFADDGTWHRFTVQASEPVVVVANPDTATPRLEIAIRSSRNNFCPGEQEDSQAGQNSQAIYLAGCAAGVGTVELRREADDTVLQTYTFTVGGEGTADADRAALVALYNATDGPNWTDNANWLSDAPIGQWYGVITDGRGRVIELHLLGNQLSGSIPPALGNLANLEWLLLLGNQLSGSIPSELGNLNNLIGLRLNGNQLSGSIPPALGNLANLKGLFLDGNQLSGSIPSELGNLANLQTLLLRGNQLSGSIPPALGNLANLEWLYLGGNQLAGCIPGSLRDVETNDLDILGLSFCGDGTTAPDLVVQSASVNTSSLTVGQSFTLSATVRNQGGSRSGSTTLRYYRSSDATISTGDTQVGTDRVDGLATSSTSSESIRLNAPSSSGTYYYGACVESISGENDPNNNCSEGVQVTVTGPDSEGGQVTVQVTTSTGEHFGWRYVPHSQRAALTYDGFTALMRAALDGDVDEVRSLWDRASSSERNATTDDGFTLMMAAVLGGDIEVVRLLWNYGSSFRRNDKTDDGFTLMMAAVLGGDIEVVRLLWNYGSSFRRNDKTDDGFTLMMAAALGGDIEVVRLLWNYGSSFRRNDKTDDGFTLMMAAVLGGDIEVVRLLWNYGSSFRRNDKTDDGFTLMMAAALGGDIEVVRLLWNYGSSFRRNDKTDDGFTLMMAAALGGDIEVVRLLWNYGSSFRRNDKTDDGFTLMMAAALGGDIEVVRLLWNYGSSFRRNDKTDDGFTLMMAAALGGDIEVVRLLWNYGSSFRRNDKTDDGYTALSLAEEASHREVVDFLRSVGATR